MVASSACAPPAAASTKRSGPRGSGGEPIEAWPPQPRRSPRTIEIQRASVKTSSRTLSPVVPTRADPRCGAIQPIFVRSRSHQNSGPNHPSHPKVMRPLPTRGPLTSRKPGYVRPLGWAAGDAGRPSSITSFT